MSLRFIAQQVQWDIARERMWEDRGALPEEDGNQLREYRVMYEENILSAEMERLNAEAKQEESKSEKKQRWREKG